MLYFITIMKLKDYECPKYDLLRIVVTNKTLTKVRILNDYITLGEAKSLFGLYEICRVADDDKNGITQIALYENKTAKMN